MKVHRNYIKNIINLIKQIMKPIVKIEAVETACGKLVYNEDTQMWDLEQDGDVVVEEITSDQLKDLKEAIEYILKSE